MLIVNNAIRTGFARTTDWGHRNNKQNKYTAKQYFKTGNIKLKHNRRSKSTILYL